MAIFKSGPDTVLSVITQLIQIDLENDEELLRFWRRCVALSRVYELLCWKEEMFANTEERPLWKAISHFEKWKFVSDAGLVSDRAGELAKLKTACHLAKLIVTTFHNTGKIPIHTWDKLQEATWLGIHTRAVLVWDSDIRDDLPEAELAGYDVDGKPEKLAGFDHFTPGILTAERPYLYIGGEMNQLLRDLNNKKARVEKCPVCHNIFVARSEKRIWCSDRCGTRERQRRQRNIRRMETKEINKKLPDYIAI